MSMYKSSGLAAAQAVSDALRYTEIALLIWFWIWTMNLRKSCACADSWKLPYIQGMLAFLFFASFLSSYYNSSNDVLTSFAQGVTLFKAPIRFVFLGLVYVYLRELEAAQCTCALGSSATVFKWLNLVQIAFLVFVLVLATSLTVTAVYKKRRGLTCESVVAGEMWYSPS